MKRVLTILLLVLFSCGAFARGLDELVPRPDSVLVQKGSFRVSGAAMRCDPGFEKSAVEAVTRFAFTSATSVPKFQKQCLLSSLTVLRCL